MVNRQSERRRIQRIHTAQPIVARIGSKRVTVVDLSLTGAKIAHEDSIGRVTEMCVLEFDWEGRRIALRCEIRRTQLQRSANPAATRTSFHSGLLFVEAMEESGRALRSFVEYHVIRALQEQKAGGDSIHTAQIPIRGNSTVIRHDLEPTAWNAGEAKPEVGFAIR